MPESYLTLVAAMKALTQGEDDEAITLPVAENGWNTRPSNDSYGVIQLDFEASASKGDDLKRDMAYEGSMDLFSRSKSGAGWIPLIGATLDEHCEASWRLNNFMYETETRLFHWEWVFQVME